MRIEVFDDRNSFVHLACGVISYFFIPLFVVFVFYEIIEHIYKYKKEKEANFFGDLVEFLFGFSMAALIARMIS